MFCVVSCKKYSRKTLRIVDVGDCDNPQRLLDGIQAFECPICGPCSHVELSFHNWFTVHSEHSTADEAMAAARELDAANEGMFEFPFRLEPVA
jgi:hypothetical protein